jgi:hypothetical protein
MNDFLENSKSFIFFLFNGLKFVFGGQKIIFWAIFGLVGVRWGRHRWPISGPIEIKDFLMCPMARLWKSRTVTEAQLRHPETKK